MRPRAQSRRDGSRSCGNQSVAGPEPGVLFGKMMGRRKMTEDRSSAGCWLASKTAMDLRRVYRAPKKAMARPRHLLSAVVRSGYGTKLHMTRPFCLVVHEDVLRRPLACTVPCDAVAGVHWSIMCQVEEGCGSKKRASPHPHWLKARLARGPAIGEPVRCSAIWRRGLGLGS